MKIGFINPTVGTIAGGSETIVHQFATHLGKDHEVTVLTGRNRNREMKKEVKEGPYELVTVPFWPRFTPLNNTATRVVRKLTPYKTESFSFYYNVLLRSSVKKRIAGMDIISTHYWVDSRLFSKLAHRLNVPSVFHILGGPYSKEFFEADKSTGYVAVSRNTRDTINNAHNIGIEDVVTPGIPSFLLSSRETRKMDDKNLSLLFVGRLQPSKGLFELLVIFKGLLKTHPHLKLTIVGDGDIFGQLKKKIADNRLEGNVNLTGTVPYQKVFDYYRSSTVLVFPTKSEVFPLVSIEAMASGLPVVASDIPGLQESTGNNAVLLPPDDIDAWVTKLDNLLKDRIRRQELSEKGIKWAGDFAWEKKAQEYGRCLQKVRKEFENRTGEGKTA
jgi:glycosyltransferase involved in cell wall biosynthesis